MNLLLGDRLMVGHQVLDLSIGVRPPVPQPKLFFVSFGKKWSAASPHGVGFGENLPRHFEIQGERAGAEGGVRADFFDPIFLLRKIGGQR